MVEITKEIKDILTEKQLTQVEEFLKIRSNFILDKDKNVIPASLLEWANFFEDIEQRRVKHEYIEGKRVSTVFIGIDHNFCWEKENYKPHVFETMVFDESGEDIYCDRYSTWQQAEEGHQRAIQWAKDGCKYDE